MPSLILWTTALYLQNSTLIQTAKFDLIERLAGAIADSLMSDPQISKLQLTVIKYPPIPNFLGSVAVEVYRER